MCAPPSNDDEETRLLNRRSSQFSLSQSFFLSFFLPLSHCFARHLSSKSLSAQLLTGLFSLRLTSLCRSHTQTLNASRDSTLGGFALISSLKSFWHIEHGYKSPSASKNRRAWIFCAADGLSCTRQRNVRQFSQSSCSLARCYECILSLANVRLRHRYAPGNTPQWCVTA